MQQPIFDSLDDVIAFADQCKTAVDNDTNETIRMRKPLQYANCEIELAYNSTANHANQYQGNDFMHVYFYYPSTLDELTIRCMMHNGLRDHETLFQRMRRHCHINRIYVHQIQNNRDEFITLTRAMAAKYVARNYNLFPGRHGWANFDDTNLATQFYDPIHFYHDGYPWAHVWEQRHHVTDCPCRIPCVPPRAPHPRGCRCRICHRA